MAKPATTTRTRKTAPKTSKPSAPIDLKAVRSGTQAVYGDVLRRAIARGDANEMRKVAAIARTWIKDAEGALRRLENSIKKIES